MKELKDIRPLSDEDIKNLLTDAHKNRQRPDTNVEWLLGLPLCSLLGKKIKYTKDGTIKDE